MEPESETRVDVTGRKLTREEFLEKYKDTKEWKDITDCKEFDELPQEAKDYIGFIQLETNVPITRVSVGPDRLQTIMR